MVPTALKYRQGLLVAPYISSMYHNNGGVTSLEKKYVSKSKESPLDDGEGGVGGLNHTLRLMKPLVTCPCPLNLMSPL
jgi:hypothetical protein